MASSDCGEAIRKPSASSQGGYCYGLKKARKGPFVIGVAGGTASGKVSFPICWGTSRSAYNIFTCVIQGRCFYEVFFESSEGIC